LPYSADIDGSGELDAVAVGGIAPDSSWLALRGDVERVVLVWHLAEDRTVAVIEYPADDGGRVVGPPVHAISPDSRWLVVGGEVSGVRIHDATTGHLVHRLAEAGAVTQVGAAVPSRQPALSNSDI
jgi:hypothetical protein